LICSVIYAVLWFAMPLGYIAFNDQYNLGSWMVALIPMLGIGGAAGMLTFDLDYFMGLVHYGLYLGICLLGRWLAGLGVLPGMLESGQPSPWDVPEASRLGPFFQLDSLSTLDHLTTCLQFCLAGI
jgi:hypothetical protein